MVGDRKRPGKEAGSVSGRRDTSSSDANVVFFLRFVLAFTCAASQLPVFWLPHDIGSDLRTHALLPKSSLLFVCGGVVGGNVNETTRGCQPTTSDGLACLL